MPFDDLSAVSLYQVTNNPQIQLLFVSESLEGMVNLVMAIVYCIQTRTISRRGPRSAYPNRVKSRTRNRYNALCLCIQKCFHDEIEKVLVIRLSNRV
jgi:hypothetical protein